MKYLTMDTYSTPEFILQIAVSEIPEWHHRVSETQESPSIENIDTQDIPESPPHHNIKKFFKPEHNTQQNHVPDHEVNM
jgi:hypothetical protein